MTGIKCPYGKQNCVNLLDLKSLEYVVDFSGFDKNVCGFYTFKKCKGAEMYQTGFNYTDWVRSDKGLGCGEEPQCILQMNHLGGICLLNLVDKKFSDPQLMAKICYEMSQVREGVKY